MSATAATVLSSREGVAYMVHDGSLADRNPNGIRWRIQMLIRAFSECGTRPWPYNFE